MGDPKRIQTLIDQTVSDVLNRALPGLREQVIQSVCEQLQHEPPTETTKMSATDSSRINAALTAVQAGNTQVEILDAMIEGISRFAARAALYVVRGDTAIGWRARGFEDNNAVRNAPVELTQGLAARAIQHRGMVSGQAAEFAPGFTERVGTPAQDAVAFPLAVRDKIVGLLYADCGISEPTMDIPALEAIVRTTALWLEIFASRKATATIEHAATRPEHASTRPSAAMAAAAVASASNIAEPLVADSAEQVRVVEPAPAIEPAAPAVADDEVIKKARRFAKLLVDEIKLYNQTKVSEGRQNRDLYDRLKDDIEKSRSSYEKRYGHTAAKSGDYFNQELIRILADNDASLLGSNFPR